MQVKRMERRGVTDVYEMTHMVSSVMRGLWLALNGKVALFNQFSNLGRCARGMQWMGRLQKSILWWNEAVGTCWRGRPWRLQWWARFEGFWSGNVRCWPIWAYRQGRVVAEERSVMVARLTYPYKGVKVYIEAFRFWGCLFGSRGVYLRNDNWSSILIISLIFAPSWQVFKSWLAGSSAGLLQKKCP